MLATMMAERPDTAAAMQLITELEAHLDPLYPPASRHGYSIEKLLARNVTFFVARYAEQPAGCGGVQLFPAEGRGQPDPYAELKRMYVRPAFRGLGLGQQMLEHLADHARSQGAALLRLETGIHQRAAIGLYERWGFRRIPPFGEYAEDPLSLFYEKRIAPEGS
jgi:ribosomal protein S18 acetylase RimI-like enzyme